MSVLFAAADAGHTGRIVLLALYRTGGEVVFGPEIAALRSRLPGLEVSVFATDRTGRIGLDELLPHAGPTTRVNLCGPAPMMQDLIGCLTELGVPRPAIRTEAFVSGRSKETRREKAHAIAIAPAAAGVTEFVIGTVGGAPGSLVVPGFPRVQSGGARCIAHSKKAAAITAAVPGRFRLFALPFQSAIASGRFRCHGI